MKITVPISGFDAHRLPLFLSVMEHCGPITNHSITLFPTANVVADAEEAANRLRTICPMVDVQPMLWEPPQIRWKSCNTLFQFTMRRLAEMGNTQPWFWMELDCLPLKRGWSDVLAAAYAKANKPYVGYVVNVPAKDATGQWKPTKEQMMMGCGMYPAQMVQMSHLWRDFGVSDRSAVEPFDRYLRFEMMRDGMAHSGLFGDRFNTCNFRIADDGTLLSDVSDKSQDFSDHSRNDVSEAWVLHGCKDDSLAKLIVAGVFEPKQVIAPPQHNYSAPPSAPAAGVSEDRVKELVGDMKKELFADIKGLLKEMLPAKEEASTPESPAPTWEQVAPCFENDKKWKLSDLAMQFNVKQAVMRALLDANGYETYTALKWIRKKELQPVE